MQARGEVEEADEAAQEGPGALSPAAPPGVVEEDGRSESVSSAFIASAASPASPEDPGKRSCFPAQDSVVTPPDAAPARSQPASVDPELQRRIRRRTAHGIGIYVICSIDYFLVFIHRLATAALGDELEQRFPGLGKEGRGVFSSLYFYLYAVAQPFCGIIVDLAKPRWTITTASAVMALGSVVIGCVPSLGVAYFGRALVGLGAAFVYVPILKMTSLWFTPRKFALLAALMIAMGGLGGFLATIPLTALISSLKQAFGGGDPANADRAANGAFLSLFVGLGVLSFIVAVVIAAVARDSPEQAGHPSLSSSSSSSPPEARGEELRELRHLGELGDESAAQCLAGSGGAGAAAGGASSGASGSPQSTEVQGVQGVQEPQEAREARESEPGGAVAMPPGATPGAESPASGGSAEPSEASNSAKSAKSARSAKRRKDGPSAGQIFVSSMREVFTTKGTVQLVLIMLGFFFFSGAYFTISASIGIDILRDVAGLSPSAAALVQGCMNLATAAYGSLESVLADKFGRKRPYVANYAVNVVIYMLLGLGCLYYRAAWYFIVLFLAIGAIPGTGIAIAYTMTKENFSLALSGTSMGVFNIAPFLGGALFQNISPLLITAEAKKGAAEVGYANMFWLLMSANVAGLVLAVFTKDTRPQVV